MITINGIPLPATEAREDKIRAEYSVRTISNALRIVKVAQAKRHCTYSTAPLDSTHRATWTALDGQIVTVTDPTGTWTGYCRVRIAQWPFPGYAILEIDVEEL